MIPAIESGYPQAEIARASYEYQRRIESEEAVVVGVNRYRESEAAAPEILRIDSSAEISQMEKLRLLRAKRDNELSTQTLNALKRAAETNANLMPPMLDAVRAYATLGEICAALKDVFGTWEERPQI
jgi:methylmalonyl-CoA mutase N-terminal domain/subunit